MAIFLFVAWGIDLAERIGILDDESWNPSVQAYRHANAAMEAVKRELCDRPLLDVQPDRVRYADSEGTEWILTGGASLEKQAADGKRVFLGDLGQHGSATFHLAEGLLEVTLVAHCEGGSPTTLRFQIPAS